MSDEAEAPGPESPRGARRPAPVIGVMGGGEAPPDIERLAEELGRLVARAGWVLLNGGRDAGVMRASARGAAAEGGLVIGVLPGRDRSGAAPHLTVAVVTGLGDARNVVNVLSADVVIALPGGAGTLCEIALAAKAGRPLVLLGWTQERRAAMTAGLGIAVESAATAAEAAECARRILDGRRADQ